MSDLLIRGKKMPKSCAECTLKYAPFGEEIGIWFCSCLSDEMSDTDVSINDRPFDIRPDWCPLVVIPTHADLVDRAELLAEYDRQHEGPPGGARKIMETARAVVKENTDA